MAEPDAPRRCKDPHLPWPGEFPYERVDARLRALGHPGLGPAASAKEVADALFDLMDGEMTDEDHHALHELQSLGRRLVVDFFLYQLPAARGQPEGEGADALPELGPLADAPPDLGPAPAPPALPPGLVPGPAPAGVPAAPADVGPVAWDEAAILGGE